MVGVRWVGVLGLGVVGVKGIGGAQGSGWGSRDRGGQNGGQG